MSTIPEEALAAEACARHSVLWFDRRLFTSSAKMHQYLRLNLVVIVIVLIFIALSAANEEGNNSNVKQKAKELIKSMIEKKMGGNGESSS